MFAVLARTPPSLCLCLTIAGACRVQPGFSTMASPDEPKKWYRFTTDRVRAPACSLSLRAPAVTRPVTHVPHAVWCRRCCVSQGGVYEYYIENTAADKHDEDLAYEHLSCVFRVPPSHSTPHVAMVVVAVAAVVCRVRLLPQLSHVTRLCAQ